MKKKKVISNKNMPARLPLFPTLVLWLVLEKTEAAGWVWGVVGTLVVFLWVAALIDLFMAEQVEILKPD